MSEFNVRLCIQNYDKAEYDRLYEAFDNAQADLIKYIAHLDVGVAISGRVIIEDTDDPHS